MVCLHDCIACQYGQHDRHHEVIQAAPEGMMGGARCPCAGDCAERNAARIKREQESIVQAMPEDWGEWDTKIPKQSTRQQPVAVSIVYVLEIGEYEQRSVAGVYSTVEAAMAERPGDWKQLDDWIDDKWVPGSTMWGHGEYIIEAYELQGD